MKRGTLLYSRSAVYCNKIVFCILPCPSISIFLHGISIRFKIKLGLVRIEIDNQILLKAWNRVFTRMDRPSMLPIGLHWQTQTLITAVYVSVCISEQAIYSCSLYILNSNLCIRCHSKAIWSWILKWRWSTRWFDREIKQYSRQRKRLWSSNQGATNQAILSKHSSLTMFTWSIYHIYT